jgi:hypothetical protein
VTLHERTVEVANRLLDELRSIGAEHDADEAWTGEELIYGTVAALRGICGDFDVDVDEAMAVVPDVKKTRRDVM